MVSPIFTSMDLTSQIIDLETALTAHATRECACGVCRSRAAGARAALIYRSPDADRLMADAVTQGDADFAQRHERFQRSEIERMRGVLAELDARRCELSTVECGQSWSSAVKLAEPVVGDVSSQVVNAAREISALPSLEEAQALQRGLVGYRRPARRRDREEEAREVRERLDRFRAEFERLEWEAARQRAEGPARDRARRDRAKRDPLVPGSYWLRR
jgi:hypothetical protein